MKNLRHFELLYNPNDWICQRKTHRRGQGFDTDKRKTGENTRHEADDDTSTQTSQGDSHFLYLRQKQIILSIFVKIAQFQIIAKNRRILTLLIQQSYYYERAHMMAGSV